MLLTETDGVNFGEERRKIYLSIDNFPVRQLKGDIVRVTGFCSEDDIEYILSYKDCDHHCIDFHLQSLNTY